MTKGKLITPDVTSGILESITRDAVITLAREELGLEVIERPVDRTELYLADEVFTCGTAAEITPVLSVDKYPVGNGEIGPVTASSSQCSRASCVAGRELPGVEDVGEPGDGPSLNSRPITGPVVPNDRACFIPCMAHARRRALLLPELDAVWLTGVVVEKLGILRAVGIGKSPARLLDFGELDHERHVAVAID